MMCNCLQQWCIQHISGLLYSGLKVINEEETSEAECSKSRWNTTHQRLSICRPSSKISSFSRILLKQLHISIADPLTNLLPNIWRALCYPEHFYSMIVDTAVMSSYCWKCLLSLSSENLLWRRFRQSSGGSWDCCLEWSSFSSWHRPRHFHAVLQKKLIRLSFFNYIKVSLPNANPIVVLLSSTSWK